MNLHRSYLFRALSFLPAISLSSYTEASSIALGPPQVVKVDWGARSLSVKDINGDGLHDLVLINNDKTQIQFFLQGAEADDLKKSKVPISNDRWNPVLEDAPFIESALTIGFPIFDLAVGDLNGDGLADLAYTSGTVPLTVRLQEAGSKWADAQEFKTFDALGWTDTVKMADITGDAALDLIVLSKDSFQVLEGSKDGPLGEPAKFFLTGENPFNLILEDVNRDGLIDVLYITAGGEQSLAMRLQLESGGFGAEVRFPFKRPIRTLSVLPRQGDQAPVFCAVDGRSGGLEFFNLEQAKPSDSTTRRELSAEVLPLFKKGRDVPSYSFGDIDADGLEDVVISVSGAPELFWISGDKHGLKQPRRFPSFTSIASISQGQFFKDRLPSLVVVSAEEAIIGLSEVEANGRLSFPKALELGEDTPILCEALDWDGDGFDELAVIYDKDSEMRLVLAAPKDRSQPELGWSILAEEDLGLMRRAPTALSKIDIFGDAGVGLALFNPREAPVFMKLDAAADAPIKECFEASSIRQSFLKGVAPSQISLADLNQDGRVELIVGRTGYARSLQVEGDELKMIDQFNARRSSDAVSAVLLRMDDPGRPEVGLYIGEAGELQWLSPEADGVFRYRSTETLGKIDLVDTPKWIRNGLSGSYILPGTDRLWKLDPLDAQWDRSILEQYETKLEDVRYTSTKSADMNGDGRTEIVAVDGQSHVVEVLEQGEEGWDSLIYWKVFEQNMHYQGRTGAKLEPREMAISQLKPQGQKALILLIHDRILVYSQ